MASMRTARLSVVSVACLIVLSVQFGQCEESAREPCDRHADCQSQYGTICGPPFLEPGQCADAQDRLCIQGFCTLIDDSVDCNMNTDCKNDLVCRRDGKCTEDLSIPGVMCLRDKHCGGGLCINGGPPTQSAGICLSDNGEWDGKNTECFRDGHCKSDDVCINRFCEEGHPFEGVQCLLDSHCPYAAPFCVEGHCRTRGPGVHCLVNNHCPRFNEFGDKVLRRVNYYKGAQGLCIDQMCTTDGGGGADVDSAWECASSQDCLYSVYNYAPQSDRETYLFCNQDRKCVFPDIPGASQCARNDHCPLSSPFCVNGRCKAEGPGVECLINSNCFDGNECFDGVCLPPRFVGGDSVECLSDTHCNDFESCLPDNTCSGRLPFPQKPEPETEKREAISEGAQSGLNVGDELVEPSGQRCLINQHCCGPSVGDARRKDCGRVCSSGFCVPREPGVEGVQCLWTGHCAGMSGWTAACVNNTCEPVEGQRCEPFDIEESLDIRVEGMEAVEEGASKLIRFGQCPSFGDWEYSCVEGTCLRECDETEDCRSGQRCEDGHCVEQGYCGDGQQQYWLQEHCDDGNNVDGDGCDASCKLEHSDIPCDTHVDCQAERDCLAQCSSFCATEILDKNKGCVSKCYKTCSKPDAVANPMLCIEGHCERFDSVDCVINNNCRGEYDVADMFLQLEPAPAVCVAGKCAEEGFGRECLFDGHCTTGVCVAGACAAKRDPDAGRECLHNLHCRDTEGSVCVSGQCVDAPDSDGVECAINSHCPYPTPFCVAGKCQAQGPGIQCFYNGHCPFLDEKKKYGAQGLCINNICTTEMDLAGRQDCESSYQCPYSSSNYVKFSERYATGFCIARKCFFPDIPGAANCQADFHCPLGTPFCVEGRCATEGPGTECVVNDHCEYSREDASTCTNSRCGFEGPGVDCLWDGHCRNGPRRGVCDLETNQCQYASGGSGEDSEKDSGIETRRRSDSAGSECVVNQHCQRGPGDDVCENGYCVDAAPGVDGVECLWAGHCEDTHFVCVANKCEPVERQFCVEQSDCPDTEDWQYDCIASTCVRQCEEPADCRASQQCGDGHCVEEGFCGDGEPQYWLEEYCDDGNTVGGDGCSASCKLEDAPCDLARGCATGACGARQSTFYSYSATAAAYATDGLADTCMQTADAALDPNPQWVRVDLERERLVSTVRFTSAGPAAQFRVLVAAADAAPGLDGAGNPGGNPTFGGILPAETEACAVSQAGEGVLEAACPPATKGQFVFVTGAAAQQALTVCEVEVFAHECLAEGAPLVCPMGFGPAEGCDSCRGCVPCPAHYYSDKVGPYECTPCPSAVGFPAPYSPPGSTSMFQCAGTAHLDGTSTLAVAEEGIAFNQGLDAWEIYLDFGVAPRVQINGLAALFLSDGGASYEAGAYEAQNFPCRADESQPAGSDLSVSLAETVCCLQEMRQDYHMTKIFRGFSDGLDLIAANDKCDADDGSDVLVNADLEVVGEGTEFVDTDGNSFANPITIEPVEESGRRAGSYYTGVQKAKITIPDAELYKVSRAITENGELTDSRELFIGLLDMIPTGTRVVDSSSQQISIVLTRTQYGSFAAYGEQNIDYDFISYLNGRALRVLNKDATVDDFEGLFPRDIISGRRDLTDEEFEAAFETAYFAEINFVWDDNLSPAFPGNPVVETSVRVSVPGDSPLALTSRAGASLYNPCTFEAIDDVFTLAPGTPLIRPLLNNYYEPLANQECGPSMWRGIRDQPPPLTTCPQITLADDKFGRVYIPLLVPVLAHPFEVKIAFDLFLSDAEGRNASLSVDMVLVVDDAVTYCDEDSASVDLAGRVKPSIVVGTESDNPPRLTGWADMADGDAFSTGAETLQDGLVTLTLALDETEGLDDNLEVFFEDVLVVHVNPGSEPDITEIKAGIEGGSPKYLPTYQYDPDTRDAWLVIPPALKSDCPAEDFSVSFFGCVHKHILRDKAIANATDAYMVGEDPPPGTGAQDFMANMLGSGTASTAARELGRDYEEEVMASAGVPGRKSVALWINPGHRWGQEVHNSEYSLSQHVVIYVLFGVRSGVDGTERRMLLQAGAGGATSLVRTLEYKVSAATLVEDMLGGEVTAVEVAASLPLSAADACLPSASLLPLCAQRLKSAVEPHASAVKEVRCLSVRVENADCERRAAQQGQVPVAVVDAVIALEKDASAFIDMDAVVASGAVLSMTQTAGAGFESPEDAAEPKSSAAAGEASASHDGAMIAIGAGAAVGAMAVMVVAWMGVQRCRHGAASPAPQPEVARAATMTDRDSSRVNKEDLERVMFSP